MDFKRFVFCCAVVSAAGFGCVGAPEGTPEDEATTTDELSGRSWERFTGAWTGESGPFRGVVFTLTNQSRGQHYFADVDTGLRCVRAPCPGAQARVEGYFTANSRTVTLNQDGASGLPLAYAGAFQYRFADRNETLVLSRSGREVARLHKQVSYCAEADDCHEQRLIVPRCLGSFSCEANACRYRCGPRPGAEGGTCGGIAGIRCEAGLTCVLSATFPDASGTCYRRPTCDTVRCEAGYFCQSVDGAPTCITRCATVRCAADTHCVADAMGARCVPNETGPRCGTTTCAAGMVCCNPLRNICTRPGMVCIQ